MKAPDSAQTQTEPDGKPLVTRKQLTMEERRALIFAAAYRRAEQRSFVPGMDLEDWLAAEREIDGQEG